MRREELIDLKKLASEVDDFREKAENLTARIRGLFGDGVNILDRDAHLQLSYASAAMRDTIPCIAEALIRLQKAYKAEKTLMDTYDGLLSKQDNDNR